MSDAGFEPATKLRYQIYRVGLRNHYAIAPDALLIFCYTYYT